MRRNLLTVLASAALVAWSGVGGEALLRAAAGSPESTLHVWPESPNPTAPYATWATASHNIQDAVDAAPEGSLVLVTNGVYATGGRVALDTLTNRLVIHRPVRVQSVNGPQVTTLVGAASVGGSYGVGAIRCAYVGPNAVLSGFTLTNGHTYEQLGVSSFDFYGGGALCEKSGSVSNCVFLGNSAFVDGGGLYGGTASHCIFTNNFARDDGGGADTATLVNCLLTGNRSLGDAGGADDCLLINCVLTENSTSGRGGGTFETTLYNCTVTRNSAHRAGGVAGRSHLEHKAYNCLVYHNKAGNSPNHDPIAFQMEFAYSCTTPLPLSGVGNISADPQLLSDFRLAATSPCRGAGLSAYAVGADQDGEPWATPPSMGADELVSGATTGPVSVRIDPDFTKVATGFAATFRSRIEGRATRIRWTFGDGAGVDNQVKAVHAWATPGAYPVVLTAFNDTNPNGVSTTVLVTVVPTPVSYVNAANSAPAFPFATWGTAAHTIQEAIDAGDVAGRVVWVTNGVYDTGGALRPGGDSAARVALTNGVTVRSVNGPAVTLLRGAAGSSEPHGAGAVRCAYVGDASVLSGFTLTNGYSRAVGHPSRDQGGGGAWCESEGILTNCVLTGSHAYRDGGGVNGGQLFDCLLHANEALDDGGGADDSVLIRCVITENKAGDGGGGADESRLEQCTLSRNEAGGGAGSDDSMLYNCLLVGNLSSYGSGASDALLHHCTVTRNAGGGAGVVGCLLYNSIVYDNDRQSNHLHSTFLFSCTIPEALGGAGNISDPPNFVNPTQGDFRLRPLSPCLDAGTNLTEVVALDLQGNPRPLRSRKDGLLAPDLGAYEFVPLFFTSASRDGDLFRVCWEKTASNVKLQRSASLLAPQWTDVPGVSGANCAELPGTVGNDFFRLFKP